MLWFTVWAVLIVGTGVGGFFLLRSVYRSGLALLAELERAAEAMAVLDEKAAELAGTVGATPAAVDLLDPEPARARLAVSAQARLERRIRRAARHADVYRRWEALTR